MKTTFKCHGRRDARGRDVRISPPTDAQVTHTRAALRLNTFSAIEFTTRGEKAVPMLDDLLLPRPPAFTRRVPSLWQRARARSTELCIRLYAAPTRPPQPSSSSMRLLGTAALPPRPLRPLRPQQQGQRPQRQPWPPHGRAPARHPWWLPQLAWSMFAAKPLAARRALRMQQRTLRPKRQWERAAGAALGRRVGTAVTTGPRWRGRSSCPSAWTHPWAACLSSATVPARAARASCPHR